MQKMLLQAENREDRNDDKELVEVVQYMLAHNLKLEQECILEKMER